MTTGKKPDKPDKEHTYGTVSKPMQAALDAVSTMKTKTGNKTKPKKDK